MKNSQSDSIRWLLGGAALLAFGAGAGYWWGHRTPAAGSTGDAAKQGATAVVSGKRRILYWHDPMVPGTRFEKPGKSPYMDMPLAPVYADEAAAGAGVRISAGTLQNLGIRLGTVELKSLGTRLDAVGIVVADEHATQVIPARVAGYVRQLAIRAPQERVRRGDRLALIESPEWIAAQGEYLALLQSESAYGESLRKAARQRLLLLGVPASAVVQLEATRTASNAIAIYAPIDGVVSELGVREGTAVTPGTLLFRIQGLSTVWVNAQIPETQLPRVALGAAVQVRTKASPDKVFAGTVAAILPQLDSSTRTLTTRIQVPNTREQLLPGMFASVAFASAAGVPQLVVPSEAVIATGERTVVIVARADGMFDVVNVTTGTEVGDQTPIVSGLSAGQQIVLSGQFLIDSEASLKSAVMRLGAVAAPPATAEPQP